MIYNKEIILKIVLDTLTIGMSCMNFLEHLILHVSHRLVVRILATGSGGPGSNPGGVTCGMGKDRTMETLGHAWCDKCVVRIEII
jgi:hypothetical protein